MADAAGGGTPIGRLRWQVTFAERQQTQDATGTGIIETPVLPQSVHADIQSVTDLTFWNGQQIDKPVTHAITMRFQDYPPNTRVIYRTTNLPDGGIRTETFRVRKFQELGGRKRFIRILTELEQAT